MRAPLKSYSTPPLHETRDRQRFVQLASIYSFGRPGLQQRARTGLRIKSGLEPTLAQPEDGSDQAGRPRQSGGSCYRPNTLSTTKTTDKQTQAVRSTIDWSRFSSIQKLYRLLRRIQPRQRLGESLSNRFKRTSKPNTG